MKTASGSVSPDPPHKYVKSPAEATNGEALADGETTGDAIDEGRCTKRTEARRINTTIPYRMSIVFVSVRNCLLLASLLNDEGGTPKYSNLCTELYLDNSTTTVVACSIVANSNFLKIIIINTSK